MAIISSISVFSKLYSNSPIPDSITIVQLYSFHMLEFCEKVSLEK